MNKKEEGLSEPVWNLPELLERVDNDQVLLRELLDIFKEDFPQTIRSLEDSRSRRGLEKLLPVESHPQGNAFQPGRNTRSRRCVKT